MAPLYFVVAHGDPGRLFSGSGLLPEPFQLLGASVFHGERTLTELSDALCWSVCALSRQSGVPLGEGVSVVCGWSIVLGMVRSNYAAMLEKRSRLVDIGSALLVCLSFRPIIVSSFLWRTYCLVRQTGEQNLCQWRFFSNIELHSLQRASLIA